MMNENKLRGAMAERNKNQGDLAKALGVNRSTLGRWLKNPSGRFTLEIINEIINFLDLSHEEAVLIFLPEQSHYCDKIKEPA